VALLGLKADAYGFENAALEGPLFHDTGGVRRSFGMIRNRGYGAHGFTRIRQDKI
jgi:hypothetical protein